MRFVQLLTQRFSGAAILPTVSITVLFSLTSCGCGSPDRSLPEKADPKYTQIERLIEKTLQPVLYVYAINSRKRDAAIDELTSLGYFKPSKRGLMPTAHARRLAASDSWPTMLGGPFRIKFEGYEHIALRIGTYSVQTLVDSHHYDGAPCGAYGDERDDYGFIAKVNLNALGRSLLAKHLLYMQIDDGAPVLRWDGRQSIRDIWSDSTEDENSGYRFVHSHASLNLESSLKYPTE